jgi:hypothetical protein
MSERSQRVASVAGVALLTKAADTLLAAVAVALSPLVCGLIVAAGLVLVVLGCWGKKPC